MAHRVRHRRSAFCHLRRGQVLRRTAPHLAHRPVEMCQAGAGQRVFPRHVAERVGHGGEQLALQRIARRQRRMPALGCRNVAGSVNERHAKPSAGRQHGARALGPCTAQRRETGRVQMRGLRGEGDQVVGEPQRRQRQRPLECRTVEGERTVGEASSAVSHRPSHRHAHRIGPCLAQGGLKQREGRWVIGGCQRNVGEPAALLHHQGTGVGGPNIDPRHGAHGLAHHLRIGKFMRLFSFIGQVTAANAAGQITVLTSSSTMDLDPCPRSHSWCK